MDAIDLDLSVCCIIGILPRERLEPQPLRLSIHMELDLEPTARTGDLSASVDYAAVDTMARFLAVEGQFRLIESLGRALLTLILLPPGPGEPRAQVARASVRLTKPDVLLSAVPAAVLSREAPWAASNRATASRGLDSIEIASLPELSASRISLTPGAVLEEGALLGLGGVAGRLASPFTAQTPCTLLQVVRR